MLKLHYLTIRLYMQRQQAKPQKRLLSQVKTYVLLTKVFKHEKRKYTYWRVLQQNNGYGWDAIEHFDLHYSTLKERKQTALEYRQNMPNCSYRWVGRRELNK